MSFRKSEESLELYFRTEGGRAAVGRVSAARRFGAAAHGQRRPPEDGAERYCEMRNESTPKRLKSHETAKSPAFVFGVERRQSPPKRSRWLHFRFA
jgi:hypothetical protein